MGVTEAEDVRATMAEMIDALNAGDVRELSALLSRRPDAVHIGTDPDEWQTSKEVLDEMAVGGDSDIQVVADDLDVHIQGDVAWVEGRGRFTSRGGGQRPIRMTGVLVRERGQWAMAQSHASIGVPNADIFS